MDLATEVDAAPSSDGSIATDFGTDSTAGTSTREVVARRRELIPFDVYAAAQFAKLAVTLGGDAPSPGRVLAAYRRVLGFEYGGRLQRRFVRPGVETVRRIWREIGPCDGYFDEEKAPSWRQVTKWMVVPKLV